LGDADLTVQVGHKKYEFLVEIKRGILSAAALPSLENLLKLVGKETSLLVAASQIGPSVAKLLRDRNIAFMDAAGNAFIAGSGLHVWISGKRTGVKQAVTGLHRQNAVKVIFALLTDPRLDKRGEQLFSIRNTRSTLRLTGTVRPTRFAFCLRLFRRRRTVSVDRREKSFSCF